MNPTKYLIKPIEHHLVKPVKIKPIKQKNSFLLRHEYKKQRREQLWRENPHCHWCGRLTVINNKSEWKHGEDHSNVATLDHLVSRLEIPYGTNRPNLYKKAKTMVLACWKCNNDRNRLVAEQLSKTNPERLWKGARNEKRSLLARLYGRYIRRYFIHYWRKIKKLKDAPT